MFVGDRATASTSLAGAATVVGVVLAYVEEAWMAADGVHIVALAVLKDLNNEDAETGRHRVVVVSRVTDCSRGCSIISHRIQFYSESGFWIEYKTYIRLVNL